MTNETRVEILQRNKDEIMKAMVTAYTESKRNRRPYSVALTAGGRVKVLVGREDELPAFYWIVYTTVKDNMQFPEGDDGGEWYADNCLEKDWLQIIERADKLDSRNE